MHNREPPDRSALRDALTSLYNLPAEDEAHELKALCLLGLAVLEVADALTTEGEAPERAPIPWGAQLHFTAAKPKGDRSP